LLKIPEVAVELRDPTHRAWIAGCPNRTRQVSFLLSSKSQFFAVADKASLLAPPSAPLQPVVCQLDQQEEESDANQCDDDISHRTKVSRHLTRLQLALVIARRGSGKFLVGNSTSRAH